MLREKAFDFWKTYIGLMTKGGVDVSMTNPAVTFTADAKAGEYDDISDEEYYELLDFTEELASFWKKNREATAGAVLLEALVNTDLSLSETDKLAQILAEASERKTYKYIKPEPEFETTFDKTPFDEGEVEWTPQMIYEYLDENVYRQENAKKAADQIVTEAIATRDTLMDEAKKEAEKCLEAVQAEVDMKLAEGKRKYIAVQDEMNEIVELINQAQIRFMASYKEVHKIVSAMPETMQELEDEDRKNDGGKTASAAAQRNRKTDDPEYGDDLDEEEEDFSEEELKQRVNR